MNKFIYSVCYIQNSKINLQISKHFKTTFVLERGRFGTMTA